MIGAGESLTDRLAALRRGERPAQPEATARPEAALDETNPSGPPPALDVPTGAMAPPPRPGAGKPTTDAGKAGQAAEPAPDSDATQQVSGAEPTQRIGGAEPTPQVGGAEPTQRIGGAEPTQRIGRQGAAGQFGGAAGGPFGTTAPGGAATGQPAGPAPVAAAFGGAPAGPAPVGPSFGGPAGGSAFGGTAGGSAFGGTAGGTAGGTPFGGTPGGPSAGGTYGTPAGSQWTVPGTGQPWTTPGGTDGGTDPAAGKPSGVKRLIGTVQGWPRKVQLAAAGGVVVLLLIGIFALSGGSDDPPPTPQAGPPTATAPAATAPEMQQHSARGISMLVPKGWKRATGGSYTDYIDPADPGRKVRIITEDFSTTSTRWAEVAEEGLQKRSTSCVKPYKQLAMNEVELAGKPAAEFEYNCGEGDAMRHGVWRGVVTGGKAYSFYLTSTEAKFAESKPIFDEMVKSFQLTSAN
ncbi:hypothetical protein GSF22_07220 [Micromonospora echinofusca]|uniref:PsbP C-terminal domain-containing protein n=2 Tax=Micromonospora echinofusca TaxID=47858 RepID=A0ABS3VMN2_MICEH|nr:hypothetical protein [Micromonospora echinofusca]